ncbi:hypothetical protein LNTAR_01317 [Lentisphaera araneosa HTCC2155]|uniref:Uncharacterized protein n=1 Tax=Lentisphaera araneosa HTCC2155 TaxID=313628 RepID=A6DR57_9BACT|nr:hypothetical protein LNTAR_01317 [Lentisphaera araneosa HTCC2155]
MTENPQKLRNINKLKFIKSLNFVIKITNLLWKIHF